MPEEAIAPEDAIAPGYPGSSSSATEEEATSGYGSTGVTNEPEEKAAPGYGGGATSGYGTSTGVTNSTDEGAAEKGDPKSGSS